MTDLGSPEANSVLMPNSKQTRQAVTPTKEPQSVDRKARTVRFRQTWVAAEAHDVRADIIVNGSDPDSTPDYGFTDL